MKDCEKPLIVVYINVYGLDRCDMITHLEHASNAIGSGFDDTVQMIFMPTYDKSGDSRIEVLNPRFVQEDEYKQIVENFSQKYNEIMQKLKGNGSSN